MRLVRYVGARGPRTGVLTSSGLVDAHDALADLADVGPPGSLVPVLAASGSLRDRLAAGAERGAVVAAADAKVTVPIEAPQKIICCWVNYPEEGAAPPPNANPIFFGKFSNALLACDEPIRLPRIAERVAVEPELAIVIGRGGGHIAPADALTHVGGYTVANDVTSFSHRLIDLIGSRGPNMMAKTFDTFCPLGPCIVTPDEIPDPQALRVRQWLNDSLEVDSSTSRMRSGVREFISYVSGFLTLCPGDVLLTGSPRPLSGRPRFLAAGDQVTIEIEAVGRLTNPVVAQP